MSSTSRKTSTKTSGSGDNKITTTIVEETVTYKDGTKTTTITETTTQGGKTTTKKTVTGDKLPDDMEKLSLNSSHPSGTQAASPQASKADGKQQTQKECIDDAVKAHNEYRKKHGVPALKHAQDLSDYAQEWAEHLVSTNSMAHSNCTLNGQRLGENIAWFSSSGSLAQFTGQKAVHNWYSEISKYDYSTDRMMKGTGHFSQVVWKGSEEVGIGRGIKDGTVIIVGSYRPAGNMAGQFKENVLPPK